MKLALLEMSLRSGHFYTLARIRTEDALSDAFSLMPPHLVTARRCLRFSSSMERTSTNGTTMTIQLCKGRSWKKSLIVHIDSSKRGYVSMTMPPKAKEEVLTSKRTYQWEKLI